MKALNLAVLFIALGLSAAAAAKVGPDQAARLGQDLTPVGAQKSANADGSIPEWTGGLSAAPSCFKSVGGRYCDPFPDDQPLFTITPANVEQYKANLTPGQFALFDRRRDSYKMLVYPTRRTFANPQFVYEATARNALSAELGGNGESLSGAATGIPFPIPGSGYEVIWNHKVRYRDVGVRRWNSQIVVAPSGDFHLVKFREDAYFVYNAPDIKPAQLDNRILYFLRLTTEPPRLAGNILLVQETMDQVKEPRSAWQYNTGQRRLRRAPDIAYDNPGPEADGLRTNDQLDMFNGAMDRYDWQLVGKREIFVPANDYRLHSDRVAYKDIVRKGHINQDLARYEKRRVWVVDSVLKKGVTHLYKRRTFYVDEDSWQIVAVDVYDQRDQLWRVQEGHHVIAYDKPYQLSVLETVYDLQNARYLLMAANNEDAETVTRSFGVEDFDPANVAKLVAQQ